MVVEYNLTGSNSFMFMYTKNTTNIELTLAVNITMLGDNSAVLVNNGLWRITLNYISGVIYKCDSCFIYEVED